MTRTVFAALTFASSLTACDLFEQTDTETTGQRGSAARRGEVDFKPGRPSDPDIPKGVPFVGDDGVDTFGRPLKRPDATVLTAMLRAKRFDDLDAAMLAYQDAFEADPRKESWPQSAVDAFSSGDAELGPLLDAWVAAKPESFGARAARGTWHTAMGYAARGSKLAKDVSPEQFDALERECRAALPDLDAAIALRPKLLAAIDTKIDTERSLGIPESARRVTYEQGLATCPTCWTIRESWMLSFSPRWGGTYEQMLDEAKTAASHTKANPALDLLPGLVEFDKCRTAWEQEGVEAALPICARATQRGPEPRVSCFHGKLLNRNGHLDDALAQFDAGLRVDPQSRSCLVGRQITLRKKERFEAAARDLLVARRLEPNRSDIESALEFILKRLRYDAREAGKAGDDPKDKRLRALANAISPGAGDPRASRGLSATNLESLQQQVEANPRDFKLHLELDKALATEQRFEEIVAMWDRFLTEQPDHAEALLERAGARWHGGDHAGGKSDAKKACNLGLKKACGVHAQMTR